MSYSVLLKRQEDFNIPEIAGVLAKVRKVPVQDVIGSAKSCWGIIQENAEEEFAKDIAAQLTAVGLDALAVPSGLLEDLPAVRDARQLRLEADALSASSAPERWERWTWEKIALVAAAGFKQTISKTVAAPQGSRIGETVMKLGVMMATGLPISIGPKKQAAPKTIETSDLVFYLDLILREPSQRLRIDAQNFDYSCLKERMEYHVLANFKLLASEISRRASLALLSRGTRVLLEGRPIREMGYNSLADLERESRWLMTLRALQLA